MSISPNIVIMTKAELLDYRDEWFDKGVQRGRFEERCDQSQAKATEGKAGMAVVEDHVRRSTAGTGLRVGEASADLPTTSEFMDVTAGETAPNSAPNHQPHAVSQGWRTDLENAPRKGRDIDLWHRQMNKRLTDCFWSHDDLPSSCRGMVLTIRRSRI